MSRAIVFDLDDTLIYFNAKNRGKVPRQTFHALRRLQREHVTMAIISANPMARFIAHQMGLGQFVTVIVQENDVQNGSTCQICWRQFPLAVKTLRTIQPIEHIVYIDDGATHLHDIAKQHNSEYLDWSLETKWCESALTLFCLV